KRLADEFVGFDGHGFIGDGFVYHTGHENHGDVTELCVLLDLGANGVAVGVGHDHVGDDGVRRILFELREGRSGVGAGNNVKIFATESDLDDFAHGGGVVDEIDGGSALGLTVGERRKDHGFAHGSSLSGLSESSESTTCSCWMSSALLESECS